MLAAEDDPKDALRPRLEAAGADLKRVHIPRPDEPPFVFPTSANDLKTRIRAFNIKLVVIDPIESYLEGSIDANMNQDVRTALGALQKVGSQTGAAIVLVRHLNKDAKTAKAIYRGSGSIAFTAASRASFLVAEKVGEPGVSVLAPIRISYNPPPPSLAFKIVGHRVLGDEEGEPADSQRVEFLGPVDMTANDLLRPTDETKRGPEPVKLETAKDFLRSALANGDEHHLKILINDAKTRGVEYRTLSRAADAIGVEKRAEGFGASRKSLWSMRDPDAPIGEKGVRNSWLKPGAAMRFRRLM
jgi:hypothetical protein